MRRKNPANAKYVKMSLQLYQVVVLEFRNLSSAIQQVDYKSYLLDFKSLVEEEGAGEVASTIAMDGNADRTAVCSYVSTLESQVTGHHTMEFFEMCAALITQLAR